MYTSLLHTHKLVVILFLVLYVVKVGILLFGSKTLLEKVRKSTKVPEMIISTLFLGTGLGMLFFIAEIKTLLIIKLLAVFASIPVGVIAFKKESKVLGILTLVLIVAAYGLAEISKRSVQKNTIDSNIVTDNNQSNYDQVAHGKGLFLANCKACHGEDGLLGLSGAKNLQISTLTETEIKNIILNGKNAMPAYKKIYGETEINALVSFVKSLKK